MRQSTALWGDKNPQHFESKREGGWRLLNNRVCADVAAE